jgi:hypothetical protein
LLKRVLVHQAITPSWRSEVTRRPVARAARTLVVLPRFVSRAVRKTANIPV